MINSKVMSLPFGHDNNVRLVNDVTDFRHNVFPTLASWSKLCLLFICLTLFTPSSPLMAHDEYRGYLTFSV